MNDRSALLSLLCEVWPEQDLGSLKSYDQVLTKIFAILDTPSISYEVVSLVFGLIKKLIGNTLLSKADLAKSKTGLRALGLKEKASERLQALLASRDQQGSDAEDSQNELEADTDKTMQGLSIEEKGDISQALLEKNINVLAHSLSAFW